MGLNKTQDALYRKRKRQAIVTFKRMKGNITMKELGERIGVSEHSARLYINDYLIPTRERFQTVRGNKFLF